MHLPSHQVSSEPSTSILLIDGDHDFGRGIAAFLSASGYTVCVTCSGREGLQRALSESWNAVILDLALPDTDPFELLRCIHRAGDLPVLTMAGKRDEKCEIMALEAGADDHLTKACSHRRLLARLQAITRRARHATRPVRQEIKVAGLQISVQERRVTIAGRAVSLTSLEFDLLLILAKAKGCVKTRDDLCTEIHAREYGALDRGVDMNVSTLRRKLGDDPRRPRFIRTVRCEGYMFIDPLAA